MLMPAGEKQPATGNRNQNFSNRTCGAAQNGALLENDGPVPEFFAIVLAALSRMLRSAVAPAPMP